MRSLPRRLFDLYIFRGQQGGLTMASVPWLTGGNPNTNPPNDFLGTTDNQPLVLKTGAPPVERLRVDTSGNVGIGMSNPAYTLHLALGKVLRIEGLQSPPLPGNPPGSTSLSLGGWGTFGIDLPGVPNGRFVVNSYGQVGIGMPNPAFALHVAPGFGVRIEGGQEDPNDPERSTLNSTLFSFGGDGVFGIDAPGVPNGRFVVQDSGNVGVGTSSPASKLHVAGDLKVDGGVTVTKVLRIEGGTSATDAADYFSFGGYGAFGIDAPGVPNGRFVVQNSGNVGIGIAAPATTLHVNGDVTVTGDVLLTGGADCAEDFDVGGSQPPEPGTVVVIDEDGALRESQEAYDGKVAGVVSGAGEYRHGLVLDKRPSQEGRIPVALVGKVHCKVDAQYSPIQVGDLLTTSPTPGHAMKALEPAKAFGAVIGKALRSLEGGQGMIPILMALQ
jgi:hypothetical protein